MSAVQFLTRGLVLTAACTLVGCNMAEPQNKGNTSYTAARHSVTGSNIKQPDNASGFSNVGSADEQSMARTSAMSQPTLPGGGAGGGAR